MADTIASSKKKGVKSKVFIVSGLIVLFLVLIIASVLVYVRGELANPNNQVWACGDGYYVPVSTSLCFIKTIVGIKEKNYIPSTTAPVLPEQKLAQKVPFFVRIGLFDVILPFILCFALFYWLFSNLAFFEKSNRKILYVIIISFIASFLLRATIKVISLINEYLSNEVWTLLLWILLIINIIITLKHIVFGKISDLKPMGSEDISSLKHVISEDIFGLIFGIVGLLLILFGNIRNIILAEILIFFGSIIGIILSANGLKKNKGIAVAGLVLNIIVLVLVIIFAILLVLANAIKVI